MTVWMTIVMVLLLVFGFKVLHKVAQVCSLPANFSRPNSVEPSTFRSIASSWYAPTTVMAVFVALSGITNLELIRHYSATPQPENNTAVDAKEEAPLTAPFQADRQAPNGNHVPAPEWIRAGDQTIGDVRQVVLTSKLWSTATEATEELQPIAAELVRADFQARHENRFGGRSHRFLTDERILYSAVKKRYLEPIDQDFGAFSAPMYRLWMQVEISPVVRTELYPAWKSGAVGERIIALGAILGLLTLAANALALFARLIRKSPDRQMRAATIVAVSSAGWIVAELVILKQLYV